MKLYKTLNIALGWFIFAFASIVYIITSEPTASFWDCGEYIATAYKLQVGHPPGAPFFQLMGRFFSLFAFGNEALVARMINTMSALASSFTILFLFWSITALAKKLVAATGEFTKPRMFAVFGSGLVGSLAFTFCDSFWFSAVEGEVYAMSSFFTAIVFWTILKWEQMADEKHSYRWLILIAFLVGISIGVHLLNLLAIPAITMVYYFKKFKPTRKGILASIGISFLILSVVMYGIIPWVVKLAGWFELFFVNGIGLPFESGTIIYFIALIGVIVWALRYTKRKLKPVLNTVILAFTFILIGYSSFLMLVIRSNANPPIDENNPENAISLLAYLNREQYGDWPIFHGAYYNAPVVAYKDGTPVYTKDREKGKYVITDARKDSKPVFDKRFTTIFPRMWSNTQSSHKTGYKNWAHKDKGIAVSIPRGEKTETVYIPTFGENLKFFFTYQLGHMYFRYFMWNFAGRQNDTQGHGTKLDGNWISGIKFLDEWTLGPQDNLPDHMKNNKARNKFYMLPLLLGLIGFFYQLKKDYRDNIIVSLLFVMTGIAIVVYLNQKPYEPRERDYAYAASFMAFSIWIGLGVLALIDTLSKKMNQSLAVGLTTVFALFLVPGIMAKEGWDDHSRARRSTALAFASNYLNSCTPNSIIFTNGDNDTFPLWYAQEVEGVRTDVRVVNLSLLNTDWYIDQMARKAYDSEPLPFSFTREQYRQGTRDVVYFIENQNIVDVNKHHDLKDLINWVASDNPATKFRPPGREPIEYFPTKKFSVPVDTAKVIRNGTVSPWDADKVVSSVEWTLNKFGVMKNHLMVLDILANFNWDRPVYFAITTGDDSYVGLTEYFQIEGLAYRFVPVKAKNPDGQTGRVNTTIMYDNMMNKFKWGNIADPRVYLDETNIRMTLNFRNNFARLAEALIREGKKDSAIAVLDRCIEVLPDYNVPINMFNLPIGEAYYHAGAIEKGDAMMAKIIDVYEQELKYYFSFPNKKVDGNITNERQRALGIMQRILQVAKQVNSEDISKRAQEVFDFYYQLYSSNTTLSNR